MEGILLGILIFILGMGGKAYLLIMAKWPILGPVIEWYLNTWGDIGTGFNATVFYGVSTLTFFITAYWTVFHAPFVMYRGIKWVIVRRAQASKEQGV